MMSSCSSKWEEKKGDQPTPEAPGKGRQQDMVTFHVGGMKGQAITPRFLK